MFQTIIGTISSFMYSKLLVILLIGAGVYFTVRTRFPQVRLFKNACGSVMEKPEDKGAISSFQALMVSTASRVGTGNIVGVSSAICIGGFGSVFWMWVIAIIGSASALIESTLAQIYKKKGKDGSCYGGPAYYIEAALHCRPLAIVFCVAMILTYAFGFNMLASYNLQSTFSVFSFYEAKMSPWIIGGILAVLTGWCLLGGGSRIVKVTSRVVPVMGIAYIGISLLVVIINIQNVPAMFVRIFEEAFDFKAIFGAFSGCLPPARSSLPDIRLPAYLGGVIGRYNGTLRRGSGRRGVSVRCSSVPEALRSALCASSARSGRAAWGCGRNGRGRLRNNI